MKPTAFQYFRPDNLAGALDLLSQHPGSKILAGGQSLVPLMNFRLIRPSALIDLNGLVELEKVEVTERELTLGALVRHRTLAEGALIEQTLPVLAEAAVHVGHPAIRIRGTLGGSLAHADPAAELPAAMVALDARFTLNSSRGAREISAREFYQGYFGTDLAEDELLVAVRIPLSEAGFGFSEVSPREGDFALAGALCERRDDGGAVTWFGLGGKPERVETKDIPSKAADRRDLWDELAGVALGSDLSRFERNLAVETAERAHARASLDAERRRSHG